MLNPIAKLLKIVIGIAATCVILVVGLIAFIHTDYVQERALQQVKELLSDHLQTHVDVGSAKISLFGQNVSIKDVCVEDLQQRKMLQVKELGVSLDLWRLMSHELCITAAKLDGLTAQLYKPRPDSAANYQFVIDAFKSKKDSVSTAPKPDKRADGKKEKLTLAVGKLNINRIKVSYNDTLQAELGSLFYKENRQGRKTGEIREVKTAFVQHTKKGPVDARLRIGVIDFQEQQSRALLSIDSLCYATDNHKPRRNAGKPKRGFFDAGHLDVVAKMNVRIDQMTPDSVVARLTNCQAVDRGSYLNVTNLNFDVTATKEGAHLRNVIIKMPNTTVKFNNASLTFPSKKLGRQLSYTTSLISGTTKLKDIAKTFAPVLHKFEMPVCFQTWMTGDKDGMRFRHVTIYTPDKKLTIKADGRIDGLKDKYKLHVQFDVHRMTTTGTKAEEVINQFVVRKFMMKQLKLLGRLNYQGHFDVIYKRELFRGELSTSAGKLDFHFDLDELNKYVLGTVHTEGLHLGKVMDMPDIGKVAATANFKFDVSKPRTAQMRKLKGGKLPIGHVDALVKEAKYKGIKVSNVTVVMDSDGAVAEGHLKAPGSFADLSCDFSFTNTTEMKKTKIKPHIRFNIFGKSTPEEKAAKEQRKAEKKAAKEKEKAAKEKRKAEEKAAKEKRKAEEKAAKEKLEAEEKAAKEKRKAEKKAEKEKRKAEKEAAKAARKAAKEAAKAQDQ